MTVNRTAATWFPCFCIEDGAEQPPVKDGPTIGVNVGVGTMAVCSEWDCRPESQGIDFSTEAAEVFGPNHRPQS